MRVRLPTTPAFPHLGPFNTYLGCHMEVTPLSLSGTSNDIKDDIFIERASLRRSNA